MILFNLGFYQLQFYYITIFINYNSILNVLFAFLIILLSMKVKFNNNFLKFLNSHSFSICLLQKLVMIPVYKKKTFLNRIILSK